MDMNKSSTKSILKDSDAETFFKNQINEIDEENIHHTGFEWR